MWGLNLKQTEGTVGEDAAKVVETKMGEAGILVGLLEKRKALELSIAEMEDAVHLARLEAIKTAKKELLANEQAIELVVLSNRYLLGKAGKAKMAGYQVWTHEVVTSRVSEVATTEDIQKLMEGFPGLLDVKLSNTAAKKLAQRAETRQEIERLGVVLEATEVVKLKAV